MEPRSIETPPPVAPERMHAAAPVLQPDPLHAWESRVVLNPAAVLITDGAVQERLAARLGIANVLSLRNRALCVMLYRAQGASDPAKNFAPSHIGLAIFTPDLHLIYRHPAPVVDAEADFQNLGAEDARCTRVGDTFHLYYAGYASEDVSREDAPRRVRICHATTKDLVDWQLHGPIEGINNVDNKNPALFPVPVNGKWLLLHRPMEGPDAMTIHLAEADSPFGPWRTRGKLMESFAYRGFSKSWIGAGGPPLHLAGNRFLMIYHQGHYTPDGRREYDLAAALLDFDRPEGPVTSRIEPLMRPSGSSEQVGDPELGVDNVLFTCANYVWHDDVIIPYAAADSRIFGARIEVAKLVEALRSHAVSA